MLLPPKLSNSTLAWPSPGRLNEALRYHLALMQHSRRELLVGALAAPLAARGETQKGLFEPVEVNHVALRVRSIAESEKFYRETFGAPGIIFEKPGQRYMRMGKNFVALFERDEPAMDHFAISVKGYVADEIEAIAKREGLNPRRSSDFVYVHDPDGPIRALKR